MPGVLSFVTGSVSIDFLNFILDLDTRLKFGTLLGQNSELVSLILPDHYQLLMCQQH